MSFFTSTTPGTSQTRQSQTFSACLWWIKRSKPNWLVVDLPLRKIMEFVSLGLFFPTVSVGKSYQIPWFQYVPVTTKQQIQNGWMDILGDEPSSQLHQWFTSPAYDVVLPVWIRGIFTIYKEPGPRQQRLYPESEKSWNCFRITELWRENIYYTSQVCS